MRKHVITVLLAQWIERPSVFEAEYPRFEPVFGLQAIRRYGVMVSIPDSDSVDLGSNPGIAFFCFSLLVLSLVFCIVTSCAHFVLLKVA